MKLGSGNRITKEAFGKTIKRAKHLPSIRTFLMMLLSTCGKLSGASLNGIRSSTTSEWQFMQRLSLTS